MQGAGVWQLFASPHHPAPGPGVLPACREGCAGVWSEGCAFIPELEEPLSFSELLQGLKERGGWVVVSASGISEVLGG